MLILALLLQSAPAGPPPSAGPRQPPATIMAEPAALLIAAADADGDARVTRAELDKALERSFAAVDSQNSGSLGYIAFADWAERYLGDRNVLPSPFDVDRDGDNRITLDELKSRFAAIFARMDRDADGVLTRAELLTIRSSAFVDRPAGADGKRRRSRR